MNEPTIVTNAFSDVLQKHRGGETLTELSHALQEAVQAVKEHCKQATVKLELTIAPATGDASSVLVICDVTTKVPKASKPSSLFFPTDQNTLVKSDPNQKEMVLQEVTRPPAETPIDLSKKLTEANVSVG